ncbi:EI24 domain-containing protein [Microbacterium sp. KUDC0406]|uniref:EI24 domain-containing protein n=1 Tax=Microbacterium sp. KUDC0406 TaxID=2909588 RepID=UPI001F45BC40|nr:EI24 domain-containing protein [Microbacterium sp. KUDC0406]UJP09176.1 EI24 domain-containing protein [Microbacterium sp. KUDC0406]
MRSPFTQNELRPLDGNPTTIWDDGQAFVTLAGTMSETADLLTEIGDSSVHKSKGTDKLGDMAKDSSGDLSDAAVRYEGTGKALRTYANALRTAQNWLDLHLEEVRNAENDYQDALDAKETADRKVSSLDHQWPWEDEPTQTEKDEASGAADAAAGSLSAAEAERNSQWHSFDHVFGTWSDAYDDAVDGVQKAMDAADNGDGFWGFVDDLLTVISVVLIVLTVVALIIGAPFTGLLAGIILGLTVLSLGLTLLKYADGRATLTEVIIATVSLLPFGIGKVLSKGAPALGAVVKGGRGVVTSVIRSGIPRMRLLHPSTWGKPFQWMAAPFRSMHNLPRPGMFVNPLKTIVNGGPEAQQIQRFLTTMNGSRWASNPAVQNFVTQTAGSLPGRFTQFLNAVNWTGAAGLTGYGAATAPW